MGTTDRRRWWWVGVGVAGVAVTGCSVALFLILYGHGLSWADQWASVLGTVMAFMAGSLSLMVWLVHRARGMAPGPGSLPRQEDVPFSKVINVRAGRDVYTADEMNFLRHGADPPIKDEEPR